MVYAKLLIRVRCFSWYQHSKLYMASFSNWTGLNCAAPETTCARPTEHAKQNSLKFTLEFTEFRQSMPFRSQQNFAYVRNQDNCAKCCLYGVLVELGAEDYSHDHFHHNWISLTGLAPGNRSQLRWRQWIMKAHSYSKINRHLNLKLNINILKRC